jgi:hypothetical protein
LQVLATDSELSDLLSLTVTAHDTFSSISVAFGADVMSTLGWTNTCYDGSDAAMATVLSEMSMDSRKTILTRRYGTTHGVGTHIEPGEVTELIPTVSMAMPASGSGNTITLEPLLAFGDLPDPKGGRKSPLRAFSRGIVNGGFVNRCWYTMCICRDTSGTLKLSLKGCAFMLVGSFIGQLQG